MIVSLLAAAVLHGVVLGGAALVASREGARSPAAPAGHVDALDVEVVEARPDPIAEQALAPLADMQHSPAPAPVGRFTPLRSPTSPPPRHVAAAEQPARPTSPNVAELATSSGPTFPALAPAPWSAPNASVPAAPAVGGQRESGSRGVSSPAPPHGTAIVSAVPRYRSNPAPDYPTPSRRRGEEGTVLLDVVVNAGGSADAVSVQRSSGYPLLDRAAVAAVRNWTFEPARFQGVALSSHVVVPVRFSLSE